MCYAYTVRENCIVYDVEQCYFSSLLSNTGSWHIDYVNTVRLVYQNSEQFGECLVYRRYQKT